MYAKKKKIHHDAVKVKTYLVVACLNTLNCLYNNTDHTAQTHRQKTKDDRKRQIGLTPDLLWFKYIIAVGKGNFFLFRYP